MTYERLTATFSLLLNSFLCGALGANKKNFFLLRSHLLNQRQGLVERRDCVLKVDDVPETICKSGGVLVNNITSLISAGTEKMAIDLAQKSLMGKAKERPDLVRQVITKVQKDGLAATLATVKARLEAPLALGYSCAGVVREVGRGAEEFRVGDRVACAGMNYASHAETVYVPKNLTVKIPDNVSFDEA